MPVMVELQGRFEALKEVAMDYAFLLDLEGIKRVIKIIPYLCPVLKFKFYILNFLTNIPCMREEIQANNSVLELIGNTPLIKLNNITAKMKGNYFAKVEAFNPGHSTKDRIALYIIEAS